MSWNLKKRVLDSMCTISMYHALVPAYNYKHFIYWVQLWLFPQFVL